MSKTSYVTAFRLTARDREHLQRLLAHRPCHAWLVNVFQILLQSDAGERAKDIARSLKISLNTVYRWRSRYLAKGVEEGLLISQRGIDRRRAAIEARVENAAIGVAMSADERAHIANLIALGSHGRSVTRRLRMLLCAADGQSAAVIARALHMDVKCMRRWLRTYLRDGLDAILKSTLRNFGS